MVKFRYTEEMKDWLRANSRGVPYDELAPRFNAVFGLSKTPRQIQCACHDHNAHNGIYKINHPCHKCHWRPVGSTRLDKDGFVKIKVAEPCHWDLAHIVEWEKHHGKIDRKKDIIMFRDGNRQNWHIDNLIKTSRRVVGVINEHMVKMVTPETIESIILLAENKVALGDAWYKLGHGTNRRCAAVNLQYHRRKNDPDYKEKRRQEYQRRKQKRMKND